MRILLTVLYYNTAAVDSGCFIMEVSNNALLSFSSFCLSIRIINKKYKMNFLWYTVSGCAKVMSDRTLYLAVMYFILEVCEVCDFKVYQVSSLASMQS